MADFYVNIVHRPEMVPEYIQKDAEQGKVEDLTRDTVLQESLDIFREGFSFSPMFSLGIKKTVNAKGELHTWLKVEKAS